MNCYECGRWMKRHTTSLWSCRCGAFVLELVPGEEQALVSFLNANFRYTTGHADPEET